MSGLNSNEQRQALGKPYQQKLKDLGMGLSMDRVLGDRVLIMPIVAYTDIDRLEKEGLIIAPASAKETNTPPPTVGEVVMVGPDVSRDRWWLVNERWIKHDKLDPAFNIAGKQWEDRPIVNVGEAVMFSRFAGMDIMLDNVAMKLVHVNEIACVLKATNPDAIELVEDNRA